MILQIWDTAGQERFLSIGNAFYKGTDCCILTYDITQENTFKSINEWKHEFQDCISSREGRVSIPFVLVGNKIDHINAREVSSDKAKKWCKDNDDIPFFETSAKDGTSVQEVFLKAGELAHKSRNNIV